MGVIFACLINISMVLFSFQTVLSRERHLLSNVGCGVLQRNVGKKIPAKIIDLGSIWKVCESGDQIRRPIPHHVVSQ
jgi:hypothetical protein